MKITVIGENCVDKFIYGEVKRLSPEAPVPVFIPIEIVYNSGMAGNVVKNIQVLDSTIEIFQYHQNKEITKTRYVDKKSNHMFIRIDEEQNIDQFQLNEKIRKDIQQSNAVIISDYDKGFLNEQALKEISLISKLLIIDTKKKIDKSLIKYFTFIKLNESEFNNNNIDQEYMDKIIITLGSKGARYLDKNYPCPEPKETIDVSGAGDTFTAAFTIRYLTTQNIEDSIIFANKMSSIVVSKRGVATP